MQNPYLLLTPGPLSTTASVKHTMLRDWCTWDDDYNRDIVQVIRQKLAEMSGAPAVYTSVLLQGSGSYGVEAALGSFIPPAGKLLVVANGAYGERIVQMAAYIGVQTMVLRTEEWQIPSVNELERTLQRNVDITHVALVHCETTSGILNPVADYSRIAKKYGKTVILDAMSSFGGMAIPMSDWGIDVLISSANKCLQGVPGFAFVIARRELMQAQGYARSLCLDLQDQWRNMDPDGKWRFTSPTHTVRAFLQALLELEQEGGIEARAARYCTNHQTLVAGMDACGYKPLVVKTLQSPFITTFLYPESDFDFSEFYQYLKQRGFVIYPGKVSKTQCFRIGHIGDVKPEDMRRLCAVIADFNRHKDLANTMST
ncbi:MAG: 2-aminoethylphosphonate--pyruvate transaminase [Gammaproteobacteria bacterium]|nr:2-aminoethylphosphonate--pyruvate transaminase [Gammaproteobacteria bacterium]